MYFGHVSFKPDLVVILHSKVNTRKSSVNLFNTATVMTLGFLLWYNLHAKQKNSLALCFNSTLWYGDVDQSKTWLKLKFGWSYSLENLKHYAVNNYSKCILWYTGIYCNHKFCIFCINVWIVKQLIEMVCC